jgi:hypothetical protein
MRLVFISSSSAPFEVFLRSSYFKEKKKKTEEDGRTNSNKKCYMYLNFYKNSLTN